jgi:hypothetical protein
MSKSYQRYEVLLPKRFNDGREIPGELVVQTLREIRKQFGAVSSETHTIQGQWQYKGRVYHDELTRIFVDVPASAETRQMFQQLKSKFKAAFQANRYLDYQFSC